jgi:hypothetical protein
MAEGMQQEMEDGDYRDDEQAFADEGLGLGDAQGQRNSRAGGGRGGGGGSGRFRRHGKGSGWRRGAARRPNQVL